MITIGILKFILAGLFFALAAVLFAAGGSSANRGRRRHTPPRRAHAMRLAVPAHAPEAVSVHHAAAARRVAHTAPLTATRDAYHAA